MSKQKIDVRKEVGHAVIDTDGHVLEMTAAVLPYIREAMGAKAFERYQRKGNSGFDAIMSKEMSLESRRRTRRPQGAWWATPASTKDLATAVVPRILYERLDELQLDFAILYTTRFIGAAGNDDEEIRRGLCRGLNDYYADTYSRFSDRLAIAGVVPMHTPEEAVAELEHCAKIGLKLATIPEGVWRPIPDPSSIAKITPHGLAPGQTHWFDNYGLDSEYDYDPVWAKYLELGLPLSSHGGVGCTPPIPFTSISNYCSNHIGNFRDKMYQLCRSLFMGGVTRRFPTLNIAFLECGVGWASTLLSDAIEHWEKRNINAIEHLDPSRIDYGQLTAMFREKGKEILAKVDDTKLEEFVRGLPIIGFPPEERDEWRHLQAAGEEELVELFAPRFYFGCESDDRSVAFAFSPSSPHGAVLRPLFGSDIGHWDVPNMKKVVPHSFSLLTEGVLTAEQYRAFVLDNPLDYLLSANPGFFDGTAIEKIASNWKSKNWRQPAKEAGTHA